MDGYHRGDDLGVARQADNLRLLGASRTLEATLELVLDNEHWQGRLAPHARHERAWTIHFAKPMGWTPQAGTLQVQATYLSDITWPVLLRCPQGLLWPGSKPVPLPR